MSVSASDKLDKNNYSEEIGRSSIPHAAILDFILIGQILSTFNRRFHSLSG